MTSNDDKVRGMANEAAGNEKQAAGKAMGDDKLRTEGVGQEINGEGQQAVGKAKDTIKDVVDRA
jgi:uncharacterized protein YjbJ (UPF0337 family)